MKTFSRIEHIKKISAVFLALMLVLTAVFPVLADKSDMPAASVSTVYAASDETTESSKTVTEITGYPAKLTGVELIPAPCCCKKACGDKK